MRTKLFIMIAMTITAVFLLFTTISNAVFAQSTSTTSTCSISESNTQIGIIQQCNSCTSNTGSCNQLNIKFNNGHTAQATSSGDTTMTSNAASSTSQINTAFASSNANVKNYAKTEDYYLSVNSVSKKVHHIK